LRFYFHLRDGDTVELDREGMDLADIAEARREATAAAREQMIEKLRGGVLRLTPQFEIADEAGQYIETIRFADALTIER